MLLQSYWIMNWFVSWGLIKHRMPLMLEGVGVWAYWLKHWPLSNQKISKEIATKSSPCIGWVGNFGVIGHFTSAGSIPIGARFSNSIMSSVNDPKHLRTGAEADLGRPVSLLFSRPASPCPGGHFTPSMMFSCFLEFFGDWDSESRNFESEQPHEIQWFDHVERWHMPCPYRSVFGRLSNSCNLATIF